ncbi:hypothetical protein F2Q70_00020890 [Brassica cretica]|uniref:Uncharacterized protein n=1 Tax=Brassica cretica TaxID=69181 RepID=A0A8S9HLE0_BRACR|nr:hypothetical protein F2Q70_00020890 [Brassica cretica]KAF2557246.1 hypothetical protein F2Q68_00014344 [Brassica cretica]
MKEVPSTYHQCVKIPLPDGVCTIKGSQNTFIACFVAERKTRERKGKPDDNDKKLKEKLQRRKRASEKGTKIKHIIIRGEGTTPQDEGKQVSQKEKENAVQKTKEETLPSSSSPSSPTKHDPKQTTTDIND